MFNLEFPENNDLLAIFTLRWTEFTTTHMIVQKLSLNFNVTIWMFTIYRQVFAIVQMVLKDITKNVQRINLYFAVVKYGSFSSNIKLLKKADWAFPKSVC